MPNLFKGHTNKWSIYFVAVMIGLSFTNIVVSIAWDQSIENNRREFQLQSVKLKEAIIRNVTAAHLAINELATFLLSDPDLSEQRFDMVIDGLFKSHPYIKGVAYSRSVNETTPEGRDKYDLPVRFQMYRTDQRPAFTDGQELTKDETIGDSISLAMHSDAVLTDAVPIPSSPGIARDYWMVKSLAAFRPQISDDDSNKREIEGVIVVLVDTEKLLGSNKPDSDLAVTLYNDTSNLSGRQLLYQTQSMLTGEGPSVEKKSEAYTLPFTTYSIKLAIDRDIYWKEVDKSGVYIALMIGLGGTLLLIALVRTRDLQTQELRERNVVIEQRVVEQTRLLAEARDDALTASRSKSEFLASMSHEIRTPLNAIIGMSELLVETPLTEEQQKYIDVFRKAGDTLLALVNDILDLSKIEARQVVLETIPFDLVEVMEGALDIYAHKAAEKNVELISVIENGTYTARLGDPSRLRQIILNLVSNALKFTDQGEIVVSVRQEDATDNENLLHFSVRDTGIGIPKDKLELIFESFTQVDSSTTRKYGGTGLGLTICQSLTGMMGGKIWVESEEEKGSIFHFTVSLEVAKKSESESTRVLLSQDKWILIVDDNSTNRLIINKQLTGQGAHVVEADSVDQALDKIDTQPPETPFDLVMVDCHMPGKDGFDLIESLKSRGHNMNTIMMLSSADLNEFTFRAEELGVKEYLVKPVKQKELQQHVSKLLSGVDLTEQRRVAAEVAEVTAKPLSILLVDDNEDNRLLINAYLKKLPYSIDEAENGLIALQKFKQNEYDVVLMDIQMPVMDGHAATQAIRNWERDNDKPRTLIIALTAHAIKEEIDKCLESGCNSHLSKPVKKSTLIETLQAL